MEDKSLVIIALAGWDIPGDCDTAFDAVWTINNAHAHWCVQSQRIIAMDDLERDETTHPDYVKDIVNAGVPVLSTEAKEKWPSVEAYPLQKVCDYLKQYDERPWLLLDNTCNYALALAMAEGWKKITALAVSWCLPYKRVDLACSLVRFRAGGLRNPPDWFKYYHPGLMTARKNLEPGSEAFHFLMGIAAATGIKIELSSETTVKNMDRDKFFYGYQEQPDVT